MKTYLIFAISLLSTSFTFSQTVVIDGVPRDTSFALNTTYQKELRYRPYIEPVRASPVSYTHLTLPTTPYV